EQRLNGEEALAFVRHRQSYAEGDLGRLDAQMRFLSGFAGALPSLKKIDLILTIYQKILPNLLTNLTEKDIIEFMIAYFKNRGSYEISLMRLPGEACYTSGAWYYVLCKGATEEMLRREFGLSETFDGDRRFTDDKKITLFNIYSSSERSYRVYTPEEVNNKKILHS
ncbi:MAG: LCP family protein, partial [Clostridia bacterium]|nr:LCP family protein [Clostridia bacterium]